MYFVSLIMFMGGLYWGNDFQTLFLGFYYFYYCCSFVGVVVGSDFVLTVSLIHYKISPYHYCNDNLIANITVKYSKNVD